MAGAVAKVAEDELLEHDQRADRHQRGQRLVGLLELDPERRAALARLQVAPDERARLAPQALGDLAELDPHLIAGQQARLGRLGQRHARTDEERLDAGHRRLHRLGDLLVGQGVHLPEHERRLLRLGKLVDVPDEEPELLALVDLVRRGGSVVGEMDVHRIDSDGLGAPKMVQASVARDPVEPRPDVDRPVVGEHRVERRGQHLLQHILGVLARAEQVATEGEQAAAVPADEDLEGSRIAPPGDRDQTLV